MSRFQGLKQTAAAKAAPALAAVPDTALRTGTVAKARENKKLVGGYFSPDVRRALHLLALEEGVTIQALLGEGLDHLMRARGKHPFGER
jgi:hypothetical protein